MSYEHLPVLVKEALDGLAIKPDGVYVDATFGRGGHSNAILEQLGSQGRLIAFDKDPQAIAVAQQQPFQSDPRFRIEHASFAELEQRIKALGLDQKIDGVLMDLGVSSPQLDDPQRGFSFLREGPLDMRMNPQQGISAAQWIATAKESDIADVLWKYGEERFSRRIARRIVQQREEQPITITTQLASLIEQAVPKREKHKHAATRSFQAIRIFVNNELDDLQQCLQQSLNVLAVGGRLSVISFHSLEDRIVKQFIAKQSKGDDIPAHVPVRAQALNKRMRKVGGLIKASDLEIQQNVRARSARLRIAEKLA